jgi:hypothetical protein
MGILKQAKGANWSISIGRESLQYSVKAVVKRPSAVRHAHGPEQNRRAALPSPLVTAAYLYVRLIPRDFGSLAYGHFPSASRKGVFRQSRCERELYIYMNGASIVAIFSRLSSSFNEVTWC